MFFSPALMGKCSRNHNYANLKATKNAEAPLHQGAWHLTLLLLFIITKPRKPDILDRQ